MSEQLCFPGFEPPVSASDGLFLALTPPAEKLSMIAEHTNRLRSAHSLRGKPLAPSCLHVSLHSLGVHDGVPPILVKAVNAAMATVGVPPFDVTFESALSFANRRWTKPVVLRAGGDLAALLELHRILGEAMIRAGLGRWVTRYFTPHMTLLYDRRIVDEHAIQAFGWTVTDVALVHSLIGRGRHIHLARWPLRQ